MKKNQAVNEAALREWDAMTKEEAGLVIGGVEACADSIESLDLSWSKAIKWGKRLCGNKLLETSFEGLMHIQMHTSRCALIIQIKILFQPI